ncbi:MAG: SPOR domain-containing protein [Pseudomonadota bacterium]
MHEHLAVRYLSITCVVVMFVLHVAVISANTSHAAGARDFLKAGKSSFETGKYSEALNLLNKSIAVGTLSPRYMAEALHYRGLAYSKNSEPARGIADFNKALFFKDTSAELKAKIYLSRAQAYKSLGLTKQAETDLQTAGKLNANLTTKIANLGAAKVSPVPVKSKSQSSQKRIDKTSAGDKSNKEETEEFKITSPLNFFQQLRQASFNGSGSSQASESTQTSYSSGGGWGASVNQSGLAFQGEQKPQSLGAPSITAPVTSSSSQNPAMAYIERQDRRQTASRSSDKSVRSERKKASRQKSEVSTKPIVGWETTESAVNKQGNEFSQGITTQGQGIDTQSIQTTVEKTDNAIVQSRLDSPVVSEAGAYRLQLAAVSSQADATKVWSRLSTNHSGLLEGQTPLFEKVSIGERVVYRIQIGPYADRLATQNMCASFKAKGLECFLVKTR